LLVYANCFWLEGDGAEEATFRAVGGWLKEQLGFGLHPDQMKEPGVVNGEKEKLSTRLKIYSSGTDLPRFYAWVLTHSDQQVRGRRWITELGLKWDYHVLHFSCVLRTVETSTMVDNQISPSQPRVVRYIVNNVQGSADVRFTRETPGLTVKSVGESLRSYDGLLTDIERSERRYPLVVISPDNSGEYVVNPSAAQERLVGLAQVIKVSDDYDHYDMIEILGKQWSAYNGAINIIYPALKKPGDIHRRFFLSDVVKKWGDEAEIVSAILAWVTSSTNPHRYRDRIRPEGILLLENRRRLQRALERAGDLSASQLKRELENAKKIDSDEIEYIKELEKEVEDLILDKQDVESRLDEALDDLNSEKLKSRALQDHLSKAGDVNAGDELLVSVLNFACRTDQPSPLECLDLVEVLFEKECIILNTAKESARKVSRFRYGRRLLSMLVKLATEYRDKLMVSGDSEAKKVFGRKEYAANESESVMNNKGMRRARAFQYNGAKVEMFKHLKINVEDDESKTIRVHFHWDFTISKVVIGYCGKHLPVISN